MKCILARLLHCLRVAAAVTPRPTLRALRRLLFALAATGSAALWAADIPPAARIVTDRYLDALRSGDVNDMQNLLGGALKTKRQALLDNPNYAYQRGDEDWQYRIDDERVTGSGVVEVDYVMTIGDTERIRKRLYLAPVPADPLSFRVVEERVLP